MSCAAWRATSYAAIRTTECRASMWSPFIRPRVKPPPELLAYRNSPNGGPPPQRDGPNWRVRVVPNKFPALGIEGNLGRQADGMFDKMNGIGAHEVIIETPDHNATLATLTPKRIEDVLWTFRDRILDLKKDRRFKYILIFKNHG